MKPSKLYRNTSFMECESSSPTGNAGAGEIDAETSCTGLAELRDKLTKIAAKMPTNVHYSLN